MAQRPDLLQAASDGKDLSVFQELTEVKHIDYYKDKDGNTLLLIAARSGHTDRVKLLLAKDAEIDIENSDGKTPLFYAAENGDKEIVELLLRSEKSFGAKSYQEAVSAAAKKGHDDIVKLALENLDSTRNNIKHYALKAFLSAAAGGHGSLLTHLIRTYDLDLERDLRRDLGREQFQKTFNRANAAGHEEVVHLLLQISIDGIGKSGNTALYLAVQAGHKDVVARLLEREDIDMNAESKDRSAFNAAIGSGREDLAEMLYAGYKTGRGNGRTVLHQATSADDAKTVKWLLTKDEVDVNAKDFYDMTPLHIASTNGFTETANLLLARNDIIINTTADDNETPLHQAAENGHTETVKVLLAKDSIIINASDVNEETPLHKAAENGHTEIVKLLLGTDRINVNAKTCEDKTPLFSALQNRHKDVIALLLARGDLDLNATEFSSGDILHWAAETGENDLIDLLLAREANAYPDRTPLTRYSENGYLRELECLLKRDGIDVNSKDKDGRTPLSRAAEKGHSKVVEMLLEYSADRNFKDSDGRTPLSWAAGNGHEEVVKQLAPYDTATLLILTKEGNKRAIDLLLRYKFNLEQRNDRGQTALHLAALLGHQDIARALMLQGVDVNSKDDYEMTPMQLSMQGKHGDVIQGLLAFKAYPEGIMGKEWRDAFRKQNEDVVRLSRGPDGEHYVDFPTTFPTGEELLQTSAGIRRCLYLLSDDLNSSVWSKFPSDVLAQSRLEPNKLQTRTKMANCNILDISISLRLSINSYLHDQPLGTTSDNKVSRIIWRSMRPMNPSSPWTTVVYFSTLPYGWIPEDGVDIFRQFFVHIKSQWLELCHKLDNHLAKRRLNQMESKGKNPEIIDFLAKDAQNLANLRTILVGQTSGAETFIKNYCLHHNANYIPKSLLELLKNDIEIGITKRIADLDQTVRDLLNIEFAWITIHETRVSTKLGQNVMLLTYVSIFYLPLGFCAVLPGVLTACKQALWAIPNITDASTRTPFILTAIIVSLITLVITLNMESIARSIQQGYNSYTAFRREKRRPQYPGLP